jgi:hypothetical protein
MRILVNHLTRMRDQRICVAGIDTATTTHVRPTTPRADPITRSMLMSEGGPFAPGAIVDLGQVSPSGSPPEIEDRRFATANARHIEDLSDADFLAMLDRVKSASIEDAFGPDVFEVRPHKFAVPKGAGKCSLAVTALDAPRLYVAWDKLWVDIDDGAVEAKLRVTDVRFYDRDHKMRIDVVDDVRRRLTQGRGAYAMLGLAHAMNDEDAGQVHWLQCNGLCLSDRATGEDP